MSETVEESTTPQHYSKLRFLGREGQSLWFTSIQLNDEHVLVTLAGPALLQADSETETITNVSDEMLWVTIDVCGVGTTKVPLCAGSWVDIRLPKGEKFRVVRVETTP